jgi:hypothetical protein
MADQCISDQELGSLITKLQQIQKNPPADLKLRKELYSTVHDLSLALETPIDTVKRIQFVASSMSCLYCSTFLLTLTAASPIGPYQDCD